MRGPTTTGATSDSAPQTVLHPAARLGPGLRAAAAGTLVLGAGLQAASWLVYAEPDQEAYYARIAEDPSIPELALALNLLSVPFLVGGVAVYVLLGRVRSPRLAWWGGGLFAAGLTALGMMLGGDAVAAALAHQGVLEPTAIEDFMFGRATLSTTVINSLFLLGVGLGIPLTVAALWRSRAVPRAAAALLLAFIVLDVAGQGGPAALPVVAHVLAFLAAGWIALAVLRRPPIG